MEYKTITGDPFIKHFAKLLALKKIGNSFNKPFASTKTEEP